MGRKGPRLLFRGLHAVIWHTHDLNRHVLESYLHRLGLSVSTCDGSDATEAAAKCDMLFYDSDQDLPVEQLGPDVPLIALVGSEAPSRLQWILSHKPGALIFKPIRSAGIYGSIVFAMNSYTERLERLADQERLATKIRYRKLVIFAVLKIMREDGCSEDEAFARLRRMAMMQRVTIEALCADIIVNRTPVPTLRGDLN